MDSGKPQLPALVEQQTLCDLLMPGVLAVKEKLSLPCPIDVRPVGEGLALFIDDKEYPILHNAHGLSLETAGEQDTFKQVFAGYAENAMKEHLDEGGVSPCRPKLTRRAMAILADIQERNKRDQGV